MNEPESAEARLFEVALECCTPAERDAYLDHACAGQPELRQRVEALLEGHVRVHLASLQSEPMAVLGPGESVGEMSVIDHQPASAFVVAAEPVRLLAMEEEILWSLVHSCHAAASNLLISLSTRLRNTDAAVCDNREQEQDFRRYGTVDALTGLHNRHWLEMVLERQIQRARMDGRPLCLIMIDIDHFKTFNDRYGHAYGDHVLYAVAHTLSDHLRPTEVIARYGGDEFVIVLPEAPLETARDIGERLHRAVMDAVPVTPSGSAIPHPTISIGLAALQEGQSGAALIAEADKALYRAKHNGRNGLSD